MTLRWSPNTCDCSVLVDGGFDFIDWEQKCFIHQSIPNDVFFNQLKDHNKSNNKVGANKTEIKQNAQSEKMRIRGLGAIKKR